MTKWVDVVAGVLLAPNGDFFLSSRPQGKPYAGYWEFPGGKLEAGETPYQALVRELDEELGLTVEEATPWLTQHFHYEHASVRLSFWRVTRWQGQPQAREGQTWAWQPAAGALNVAPVLPANTPVFRALSLPATLALTCASETGAAAILARIGADPAAFPLVVVREPGWADVDRVQLAHEIRALIAGSGGRVLLAGATTPVAGLDGVHLTAAQLMALDTR
ncbi:NUDIX domain-containing protein, partial [Laribacter hongkongensis]